MKNYNTTIEKRFLKDNRFDVFNRALQVLENKLGRIFSQKEMDSFVEVMESNGCYVISNDLKKPKIFIEPLSKFGEVIEIGVENETFYIKGERNEL